MKTKPPITLIYDHQCPACDLYCHLIRLRASNEDFRLIDARENNAWTRSIHDKGWDIDQGMVLVVGDAWYYGDEAIHTLALLSSNADLFNRLNIWIFRSRRRAAILYPLLRILRNLLLKLTGRRKINPPTVSRPV